MNESIYISVSFAIDKNLIRKIYCISSKASISCIANEKKNSECDDERNDMWSFPHIHSFHLQKSEIRTNRAERIEIVRESLREGDENEANTFL